MHKKTKKKKWLKFRHRVVRRIVPIVLYPYTVLKYGVKIKPFKADKKTPYLILYNHQTPFDQFFVGFSFKNPVYYVATEDIFSKGFVSTLIRWLVAPIPIKKQSTDISAVLNCLRVAKEGGTIAIAPEGNRTYSGKTEHINPVIASLARRLKMPIALYRIEGGYGVQPRWSNKTRKGKMNAYVSKVITPDEYADISDEELFELIKEGLTVNDCVSGGSYKSKKRAEYLERAVYVCPYCGLSAFESHDNTVKCQKCGREVIYGEDIQLKGVGFDFKFTYVSEWYDYQQDYINALDVTKLTDKPLYTDSISLDEVIVYKHKQPILKTATATLYGNRLIIKGESGEEYAFPFDEVSAMAVLGRNKLNVYYDKKVYQLKGGKRFNALKNMHMYYRYKNISKGEENGKFLGL